jgi:hypothetical protein
MPDDTCIFLPVHAAFQPQWEGLRQRVATASGGPLSFLCHSSIFREREYIRSASYGAAQYDISVPSCESA